MIKLVRALCLVPLTAFCLESAAAQAQTSPAPGAAASMSQGHMQQATIGSDKMKPAMMAGMDSMQKMPITGDTSIFQFRCEPEAKPGWPQSSYRLTGLKEAV